MQVAAVDYISLDVLTEENLFWLYFVILINIKDVDVVDTWSHWVVQRKHKLFVLLRNFLLFVFSASQSNIEDKILATSAIVAIDMEF